jgi:putative hydrolase of the HAD superfamily
MNSKPLLEASPDRPRPDWAGIEMVFLDLDGTLLDKYFDDYFWEEAVPTRYAEKHGVSFSQARAKLLATYKKVENTLAWTDLNHWAREIDLDIIGLKRETSHLVALRPQTLTFLDHLKSTGLPVILTTNAHPESLAIKMERFDLRGYFSTMVCSQEVGAAKEQQVFWQELQTHVPYRPANTLLIDDTEKVLRSAEDYGIAHLIHIAKPSSKSRPQYSLRYPSIVDFNDLEFR